MAQEIEKNRAASAPAKVRQWQPPAIQDYNSRYPGFAHRLVDASRVRGSVSRLEQMLRNGWEIAPYGNEGQKGNRFTGASSPDGAVHYRGLVLMRMPSDMAAARNAFYRDKGNRLISASQALARARKESRRINQQNVEGLTSTFGTSVIHKGKNVQRTAFDSKRDGDGDPERALRDVRPEDIRDLSEREAAQQEENRRLRDENERLKRENEERKKRPSDRTRKSFPVS